MPNSATPSCATTELTYNQLRQLRLETKAHDTAVERLHRSTQQAEERAYASSTVYGRKLVKEALPAACEHISANFKAITNGRAGKDYAKIRACLEKMDPEVIALISLKITLDGLGHIKGGLKLATLVNNVGHALQTEARLSAFKKQNPGLYRTMMSDFHGGTGTRQKDTVLSMKFRKRGYIFSDWHTKSIQAVGLWAVKMISESTGFMRIVPIRDGKKTTNYIQPTPAFVQLRDSILEQAERLVFTNWPMLCPPTPWDGSTGQQGGYLTQDLHVSSKRKVNVPNAPAPINAINNLQNTAWRINLPVLQCAQELALTYTSIGSFHCEEATEVYNYLTDDSTSEEIARYKREARETYNRNSTLAQRNHRTSESLRVAAAFAHEERFYLPYFFDFRGRIYSKTVSIDPQGTDFDKSLLLFADAGPVDEWWLAFQVATTFGLDKAVLNDRVDWTRSHKDLITLVASDPAGAYRLWSEADEPWCFLAACIEYYECCIAKTRDTSGLPIGTDATCSGLQHLSALTRDKAAAEQVNVVPTAVPGDAYRTVAEKALPVVPGVFKPHMDRKLTKRTVMTLPYGLTKGGARDHLQEALDERGIKYCQEELKELVDVVYEFAIPETFPGAVRAMEFLQETAIEVLNHRDNIEWISPSGFKVIQDKRESNTIVIKTQILGVGRVQVHMQDGYGRVLPLKHRAGIAPNYIHSLDSALIHLAFSEWDRPVSAIHDCIQGRSCDMSELNALVRKTFSDMYKDAPLDRFATEQQVDIPDGVMVGDLDLNEVLQSDFFFC